MSNFAVHYSFSAYPPLPNLSDGRASSFLNDLDGLFLPGGGVRRKRPVRERKLLSVREGRTPKSIAHLSASQSSPSSAPLPVGHWLQISEMSSGGPNNGQDASTFSGTSFSESISALNLRPRHGPITYSPLHPSPTSAPSSSSPSPSPSPSSSSSSSSCGSEDGTLTPLPTLQTPPSLQPGLQTFQYYEKVSQTLQESIIKDWVPHVMSAEEVAQYRSATLRRLKRVRVLEHEQDRKLPLYDPNVEQALFMARLDYRIRFYRIFRINHLPNEILTNIFRLVGWSANHPDLNVKYRLTMTATCRHWRYVALEDHTLWNAIWCKDTPNFERSLTWYARSGNAPIDLRINDTVANPWSLDMTRYLVDRLFTKLSQIRVFIIVLHEWDPILYILDSLRRVAAQNLPMFMERLEIHRSSAAYIQIGKGYEPNFYLAPIPLFGGAVVSSFRNLSLNGVHIDWTNSTRTLQNLTTLDIRRIPLERAPTIHEFRTILSDSPHMQKLVLDGAGPKWPTQPIPMLKPIVLSELKVLVLGDFSLPYGSYILSQISCPGVNDLTLMNLVGEDYSPFYYALTGKLPVLKSLTLYGAELVGSPQASAIIVKWLASMPQIGFMRIKNVSEPFMKLFLYDTEQLKMYGTGISEKPKHPALPELKYLEIHGMDPGKMKEWAVSRHIMGLPLRKIYVGNATAEQMQKEGLQKLAEALKAASGTVHVMNYPGKPPEEQELTR